MDPKNKDELMTVENPTQESPVQETPAQETNESWSSVKFHGTGAEYFRIWIVNLALTLLTLGIYSAWATVRNRRYFYGNTEVAGGRMDFHGKPLQILFGRILAIILLLAWTQGGLLHPALPYGAIMIIMALLPLLLVRGMKFRLRNTSLRNLRFDFTASASTAYKALWPYLIALLIAASATVLYTEEMTKLGEQMETEQVETEMDSTELFQEALEEAELKREALEENGYEEEALEEGALEEEASSNESSEAELQESIFKLLGLYFFGLFIMSFIFPLFICDVRKLNTNHSAYGNTSFTVSLFKGRFLKYFWQAVGLVFLIVAIASLIGVGVGAVFSDLSPIIMTIVSVGVIYILSIFAYAAAFAFWRGRIFNDTFNTLTLGDIKFRSQLRIRPYAKLFIVNTLLMLFTLGFAYPWVKIRTLRFQLCNIDYCGDADQFIGKAQEDQLAIGHEVGEAFDFDFGF